jgi:hypothetical protein
MTRDLLCGKGGLLAAVLMADNYGMIQDLRLELDVLIRSILGISENRNLSWKCL